MSLGENEESHYHGGYGLDVRPRTYVEKMAPFFNEIATDLANLGIKVWNTNPNSKLNDFEKCTIEEAINDAK